LPKLANGAWSRIVYVIELDPSACADRRSSCARECNGKPVYVGQTAHTAEDRFAQHCEGYKSSRWVKNYGKRVNAALTAGLNGFATVADSQAAEAELGRELRTRGYCVYGAH
jgi:hypothetical protein